MHQRPYFDQDISSYLTDIIQLYRTVYSDTSPAQIQAITQLVQAEHMSGEVVVYNQQLAGFIIWTQSQDDCADIIELCIDDRFRRQGLAAQLLENMARYAITQNISLITLEDRQTNQPARALYQKIGFEILDIRTGYYQAQDKAVDGLVMGWQIGGK